jgi:hypothetical protein
MTQTTTHRCEVCVGTGTVFVEGPNGTPAGSRPCPLCGGRGTDEYVGENREARATFWQGLGPKLLIATGLLVWSNDWSWTWSPDPIYALHLMLWPVLVVGWIIWLINRPPSRRQSRHAPGFTDDREKIGLGLFGAAVLAGEAIENHRKKSS